MAGKTIAEIESLPFKSFDGTERRGVPHEAGRGQTRLEASADRDDPRRPARPAGARLQRQGAGLRGEGLRRLMVNYRGSTGYGQKFADAIFNDQDGGEAKDVLAGVDAALAKYPWLDADRLGIEGGSYGGQLTDWLITQTTRFKAAVPAAGIANLVSFNYMSYYHDYLAVEFGVLPHEQWKMNDQAAPRRWPTSCGSDRRSATSTNVKTPMMFVHGENDNDVPIAEAEQFFIALKDVGVETIMVRYPREGHGVRETKHQIDVIDRSIAWYEKHFQSAGASTEAR